MKSIPHIAVVITAFILLAADEKEKQPKPKSAADFLKRGDSFYKDGKLDEAIKDYTKALKLLFDAEDLGSLRSSFSRMNSWFVPHRQSVMLDKYRLKKQLRDIESQLEKKDAAPDPKLILQKKRLQ